MMLERWGKSNQFTLPALDQKDISSENPYFSGTKG